MRRLLSLSLSLLATAALAQTPDAGWERLAGLWGETRSFGPEVRGALTLRRGADGWHASIAGLSAEVRWERDEVSFTLPGGKGSFRGRREPGGRLLRGSWIQPVGAATGVAWATPMDLQPLGPDAWRGTVTPLEEQVTLYLDVAAENGAPTAVLRNPDGYYRNGKLAVRLEGSRLSLLSLRDGRTLMEGEYDAKADRILLPITEVGTRIELRRRPREEAVSYYPRTPAAPRYAYRAPLADGDGWHTGSLAGAGFDVAAVAAVVQSLADTDPRPQTAPLVHSLLVARHGKLVLEEYFFGFDEETPHDLRSAGKNFASVLAGLAIDRGARLGPESRVYAAFPEYRGLANPDPRKERMTLAHLMTMTSGFDCDENRDEAPGNEDRMQSQTAQPDWYRFMLDLPLHDAPGDAAAYCSGAVNLIGGVVRNATGAWLPEYFDRHFARPLQFRTYHMNLTPTGELYLGGGMHLRPRDLLKLGQLYLAGGVWNGRRVVSKRWVDESVALHPMNAGGKDGYNWHVNQIAAGGRTYRQYEANGNGGQLTMVVPELDVVVGFTAGNYMNYGVWRKFREELLPRILLAIKER